MSNPYHRSIKLPVEFVDVDYPITEEVLGFKNNLIPRDMINPEFHKWIESLGLYVDPKWGRYFHSHPHQVYSIHADSKESIKPRVKLNLIFDSYDTEMIWYKIKEEDNIKDKRILNTIYTMRAKTITTIRNYNENNCVEIYRTKVNDHCILDSAKIHSLINGENQGKNRRCFSLTLARLSDKELITFEETLDKMKDYIV